MSNKNSRNLIIYDTNYDIKKIENESNNWLKSNMQVYTIYYGHVFNPPFFNNIITKRKNTLEDVQKIWNMTLIGGYFIIENKYENYFKDYLVENNKNNKNDKNNKNMKVITVMKKTGFSHIFPKYRVVDFIIAGTMKGGTSAAKVNFAKHPDISIVEKEIHYFDNIDNFQKGLQWYKNHFDYSKKMVGDKNHDIMYEYSCLELVQNANPQVKLIFFLRNPIERAYSHWKMLRDIFHYKFSFEYSVMDEINNRMGENRDPKLAFYYHIVQRGFYYEQISKIMKYFPRDNIYITISEKTRNNMNEEYQKIFAFLNLPSYNDNFEEVFVSHSQDKVEKDSKIYTVLQKLYSEDVKKLEKLLGYKTDWW